METHVLQSVAEMGLNDWIRQDRPDNFQRQYSHHGRPYEVLIQPASEVDELPAAYATSDDFILTVYWVNREAGDPNTDRTDYHSPLYRLPLHRAG